MKIEMKVFTIGYAGYEREAFVQALKAHGVNYVMDVRSVASSRRRPEYDRAAVEKYLAVHRIQYCHMPDEFGARQTDARYFNEEEYVDFGLFSASEAFERGIKVVEQMARQGICCALMCAEKDAMECHRSILIGRRFRELGWEVIHLHPGGEETQEALEGRLLTLYFPDRFQLSMLEEMREEAEWLNEAYRLQNRKIGYRKEE